MRWYDFIPTQTDPASFGPDYEGYVYVEWKEVYITTIFAGDSRILGLTCAHQLAAMDGKLLPEE